MKRLARVGKKGARKTSQIQRRCPECCCAAGICCDRAKANAALAAMMVADLGYSPEQARRHVVWLRKNFALAPKSFEAVVAEIVQMAADSPR